MANTLSAIVIRWVLVGSLFSVLALLSAYHYVFDLLSHFRLQYLILIAISLLVAVLSRRYLACVTLLLCLLVHVVAVVMPMLPIEDQTPLNASSLRIMTSNLEASNTGYKAHIQYLHSIDPDVIVFQEYTHRWKNAFSGEFDAYEFKEEVPSEGGFGIALYSKLPLQNTKVLSLVSNSFPSLQSEIILGDGSLRLLGTHPPPPLSKALYASRNQQLNKISEWVHAQTTPAIVAGDLNISPWSHHFKQFIDESALRNPRVGVRLLPTWPTHFPLMFIPIDHILVSHGLRISSMGVSHGLASDHRALWADVHY